MTEAMPFLQKFDITFLRPPPISERRSFLFILSAAQPAGGQLGAGSAASSASRKLLLSCIISTISGVPLWSQKI